MPDPVINCPRTREDVLPTVIVVPAVVAAVVLTVPFPASPVTGPKVNWVAAVTAVAMLLLRVNVVGPVMDVITELAGMLVPDTVSPSTRPTVVGTVRTFCSVFATTMVYCVVPPAGSLMLGCKTQVPGPNLVSDVAAPPVPRLFMTTPWIVLLKVLLPPR